MEETKESKLKTKTAHGLFWGGLSNGLQQMLGIAFGVILARLLSPGDYGMIAMLTVFSLVASQIQESGFTSAIAIRKKVSTNDYNAVFWFSVITSLSLYTILFFTAPLIANYNHTPELIPLARYSFLGFVISSLGTAHFAMLFREIRAKERTIATFTASITSGIVGIILAFNGFAYWGLATQDLVYKIVVTSMFWHFSGFRPSFKVSFKPIKEMFGFSSKILATNILNNINNQLLQTLLGHFYPRGAVGQYSQANKWTTTGYSFIGGMVCTIAQPILAQVGDERERQNRVFRKMLRFTAFLAFPALFGLALVAPEFVEIALGEKWLPCVPYLRILCCAGAFIPVSQLYSNLIISGGRSTTYLYSTSSLLIIQLLIMFLAYPYGLTTMLILIASINVIWLAVWHLLSRKQTGLPLLSSVFDIAPFMLISFLSMAGGLTANLITSNVIAILILKITFAASIYVAAMIMLKVEIFKECLKFFKEKIHRK